MEQDEELFENLKNLSLTHSRKKIVEVLDAATSILVLHFNIPSNNSSMNLQTEEERKERGNRISDVVKIVLQHITNNDTKFYIEIRSVINLFFWHMDKLVPRMDMYDLIKTQNWTMDQVIDKFHHIVETLS